MINIIYDYFFNKNVESNSKIICMYLNNEIETVLIDEFCLGGSTKPYCFHHCQIIFKDETTHETYLEGFLLYTFWKYLKFGTTKECLNHLEYQINLFNKKYKSSTVEQLYSIYFKQISNKTTDDNINVMIV